MSQLICDLDKNDEIFKAIQTILYAVSHLRKKIKNYEAIENERDNLKETVNTLQLVLSNVSNENRRKRTKTATPPYDTSISVASLQDVTNEDLNAAFHSSTCFDDDINQIDTSRMNPHRSMLSPADPRKIEQNKENGRDASGRTLSSLISIEEKSPTVLNRNRNRKDAKPSSPDKVQTTPRRQPIQKNSPTSTGSKNGTPRRLFDAWRSPSTSKRSPSSPQPKSNGNIKTKRHSLSLSSTSSAARLKQSTINFPKQIDETFCPGIPLHENDNTMPSPDKIAKIKIEPKQEMSYSSYEKNGEDSSNDSDKIIAIEKEPEIIEVDESSQELSAFIRAIQGEMNDQTQSSGSIKSPQLSCSDCDRYHQMLGRVTNSKNPIKKYGVCSKHNQNNACPDTPPNFWNPKIPNTPEHERLSTPFDPKYAKD